MLAEQKIFPLEGGELWRAGRDELERFVHFAHPGQGVGWERASAANRNEVWTIRDFPMRQAETPECARLGHDGGRLAEQRGETSGILAVSYARQTCERQQRNTVNLTVLSFGKAGTNQEARSG
jgi:hypothetical protein